MPVGEDGGALCRVLQIAREQRLADGEEHGNERHRPERHGRDVFCQQHKPFARERVAVTGVQEVERRHRHQEGRTSRKASPHAVVNERASFVGKASAAKLQRRLTELHAAGVVGELVIGRPHPLEYDRAGQFTIMWNDPALNIPWPARRPILSRRDAGKEDV